MGGEVGLGRFADHARITLAGPLADPAPVYDAHRVFVAPTRFAADVWYKVHDAAAHGLPVVATELLRAQLGWAEGEEMLCADASDPAGFAAQIVRLYRDPALWERIRAGALARIEAENGREHYARAAGRTPNRAAAPARAFRSPGGVRLWVGPPPRESGDMLGADDRRS